MNVIIQGFHHLAISLYCLPSVGMLVLGLAWPKSKSSATQLCCEQNPNDFSFGNLHWVQISQYIMYLLHFMFVKVNIKATDPNFYSGDGVTAW